MGQERKDRQRWVWRTEIGVLSCNSGLIWPDLERTTVHGRARTSRVTGHKEPLCQVTEHREKDKGLEGCDMTNMRGFAGLWGDWHYSRGWLTLLICITHQSRSQQRRADKPHMQPRHMSENTASAHSAQTRIFTQSSTRISNDTSNKDIWFMYKDCSRQTKACHQLDGNAHLWRQMSISIKSPFLLLTKLLFLSLREQVQRSATSSIKWGTQRLANLSGYKLQRIPASDESKGANDRLALSYCYYHHCQRKEGSFFLSYNWVPPPPYQQCLWRIWSLSLRLLNGSKHFSRGQIAESLISVSASGTDP